MDDLIPTLFISYSHDDEEHKEWAFKLAYDLRVIGGINVLFDQWSVRLGGSLNRFMQRDLTDSRLVLCICSEGYEKRSKDPSTGVGQEMEILKKKLNNGDSDYIIPVIKNNPEKRVPKNLSLNNIKYTNADECTYEEVFDELINRIWSEDLRKIPPIGNNPFSNRGSTELDRKLINHEVMYHNPNFEGTVRFNYKDNDGEFIIGRGDYTFTTKWSECGHNRIHAYKDGKDIKRIAFDTTNYQMPNSIKEILDKYETKSFSSRVRQPKIGELVIWENNNDKFAVTKIEDVNRDKDNGKFELKFSYKIIEK